VRVYHNEELMQRNMGTVDRTIRLILAGMVAVLILTDQLNGLAAVFLTLGAIAFAASGLTAFCPMYAPLKIRTNKRR